MEDVLSIGVFLAGVMLLYAAALVVDVMVCRAIESACGAKEPQPAPPKIADRGPRPTSPAPPNPCTWCPPAKSPAPEPPKAPPVSGVA